jgi:hypothetical protein
VIANSMHGRNFIGGVPERTLVQLNYNYGTAGRLVGMVTRTGCLTVLAGATNARAYPAGQTLPFAL